MLLCHYKNLHFGRVNHLSFRSGSGRSKRETAAAESAASPSKNSVVTSENDSWTAQELSNLKTMFKRIDATADGKMSRKEIAWFVNRRVNHHMQT